jgi:hypothetical protein
MKRFIAIVAFVAAMFVAGNAQAQLSVRFGYAPETFSSGSTSTNFDGFFVGVHNNFDLKSGLQFSLGVQGRMNMKNNKESNALGSITTKKTQLLVDVPVTLNYSVAFGSNVKVTPFVGPMATLALSARPRPSPMKTSSTPIQNTPPIGTATTATTAVSTSAFSAE